MEVLEELLQLFGKQLGRKQLLFKRGELGREQFLVFVPVLKRRELVSAAAT